MKLLPFSIASFQAAPSAAKAKTEPAGLGQKAIAQVEKAGGSVREIAQNDNRREVDFHLQGEKVTDEHLAPLAQIPNIVSLNLANTSVTDAGLAHVKPLTGLLRLHLEGTKVTDKGLAHLKDLKNLTYLNLYGTEVSDAGLAHLAGLTNLKSLYVWQTKVTDEGINKLKQGLPNLDIVKGW